MSEALSQPSKGPGGIIRRVSGRVSGATRGLRRQSSTQNMPSRAVSREASCGPVIARRRSGSKVGADLEEGIPDAFPELDDPLAWESTSQPSRDPSVAPGRRFPLTPRHVPELQEAPVIHDILRRGSLLTKVTKRKRKQIMFVLDPHTARVSWNSWSKKFFVDDIEDILVRESAREFREQLEIPAELESRWFTIIVADRTRNKGRPYSPVHLIAPNAEVFHIWTRTLRDLYEFRRAIMTGLAGPGLNERTLEKKWRIEMDRRAKEQWPIADDESLDFASVERICRTLHINCSQPLLRSKFDQADPSKAGRLDYRKFRNFVKDLKEREDIKAIYDELTAEFPHGLTYPAFIHFLETSQGINTSAKPLEWEATFSRFANSSGPGDAESDPSREPTMDLNAFNAFLSSPGNHILSLKASGERFDRPLNEYFVASSHNTYLIGKQMGDNSSTEGYRLALQAGCRCVEIDCWDGKGANGRPEVRHIKFTNSVLFADCVAVIAKYAFERSPYPLILSLEVHCSPTQQQMMVDIMKKEFGSRLVDEPLGANGRALPSPEELRNRILVKVKSMDEPTLEGLVEPAPTSAPLPSGRRQRSISQPFTQPGSGVPSSFNLDSIPPLSSPPSVGPPDDVVLRARTSLATLNVNSTSDESDYPTVPSSPQRSAKPRRCKIIEPLDKLAVYTRGSKLAENHHLGNTRYNHIFSIHERRLDGLSSDWQWTRLLERHNLLYLMRTYPHRWRLNSSNFEPIKHWRRGVQMAALNYQTYDEGMQINEAMFASGPDRLGYVLKPAELRAAPTTVRPGPFAGPAAPLMDVVTKTRIALTLDLVSAQFLESPRKPGSDGVPNPYVEVQVYVADDRASAPVFAVGGLEAPVRDAGRAPGGAVQARRRSAIVPGNGYNPSFNERFRFHIETKHPELVFVRWSVWNSADGRSYQDGANGSPEATFTAKYASLGAGFRHVPLSNHNGEQFMFSTLFCRVHKDEQRGTERVGHPPAPEKVGRLRQIFRKTAADRKNSFDL